MADDSTTVNLLGPDSPEELLRMTNITQVEQEHIDRMNAFAANGSSYIFEHGQRPSTVGLVLSSNPLAMLAWYVESPTKGPRSHYGTSYVLPLTFTS